MKKEELARIGGMQYALKIVNEAKATGNDPVAALEKEVSFRCKYKVPISVSQKALDEFTSNVKMHMFDSMKIIIGLTLRDLFGFSSVRLTRFYKKFEENCECVLKDYVTFEDMAKTLEEECRMKIDPIRENTKNVHV